MNSKSIFLITITVFLTLLFGVFLSGFETASNYICLALILLVGIPHGALDNFLLQKNSTLTNLKFHLFYSGAVVAYLIFWFIFPSVSLIIFLLISSYHFGESQLASLRSPFIFSKSIHFFWGLSIVLTLLYFNFHVFYSSLMNYDIFKPITSALTEGLFFTVMVLSNIILICMLVIAYTLKLFTLPKLYTAFYFLDFVVGFTIYFVFWHSLVVLNLILNYFRRANTVGIIEFIKLLLPNTAISFLIGLVLFAGINFLNFKIDFTSVVFVLLSALTMPHVFIMEKFNEKISKA
jgi:beta-carotene 15,15'-dioxygenase